MMSKVPEWLLAEEPSLQVLQALLTVSSRHLEVELAVEQHLAAADLEYVSVH